MCRHTLWESVNFILICRYSQYNVSCPTYVQAHACSTYRKLRHCSPHAFQVVISFVYSDPFPLWSSYPPNLFQYSRCVLYNTYRFTRMHTSYTSYLFLCTYFTISLITVFIVRHELYTPHPPPLIQIMLTGL